MKNVRVFYLKFSVLEVKISIYLNKRVFVMEANLRLMIRSGQVSKSSEILSMSPFLGKWLLIIDLVSF